MATTPLVSVVTPSFNQAQFIQETLRSVEIQRYRPIHQIVIDGGSTDGTVALLERWEKEDHGSGYTFEWISERDRGHADALNKGFDRARGEIVGWLNSDDVYFDREVISTSVEALLRHPDIDVVHGDCALISETSGLQMIWCFPDFKYERALRKFFICQPTVFLRRSVTQKHRLDSSLKFAIDLIYWLQIGRGHKFHKIHRVQAGDRDHRGRIQQVSKTEMAQTSHDAYVEWGSKRMHGALSGLQDGVTRILLRIRGLFYLLPLLAHKRRLTDLAFPMWVDSSFRTVLRQATMRINNRTDLGYKPCSRGGSSIVG